MGSKTTMADVRVIHDPVVPLDMRARMAGRVRWLRATIETLTAECYGIPYPPVDVIATAWHSTLTDGTPFPVPAAVRIRPNADGVFHLAVHLTAPALLEYDDDLILGILAHEYLQVV